MTEQETQTTKEAPWFLKELRKMWKNEERGELALLRRSLSPSQRHKAYPVFARLRTLGDEPKNKVKQTLAGLFAFHSKESLEESFNMGAGIRRLNYLVEKKDGNSEKKDQSPVEKRFLWLLSSDRNELSERLFKFFSSFKSKDIPVNFEKLYTDMKYWPGKDDRIKMDWAKSFWNAEDNESSDSETEQPKTKNDEEK